MRGAMMHGLAAGAALLLLALPASRAAAEAPTPPAATSPTEPAPAAPPPTTVDAPSPSVAAPAPAVVETPVLEPPPPPPPPAPPPPAAPEPPALRRYGDRGTPEIAVGLGYSSVSGFLAAGGFRYFVLDGVAPGVEATYVHGGTGTLSYGLALASLRVVPLRTASVALVLTGRAGRVFLADHADGWGAGGGGGVIIALGGGAGLEVGYEFLHLYPSSVCADVGCVLQGPVFGLRFGF